MFGKAILKWGMIAANLVAGSIMLLTLLGTVLSPDKFIFLAYLPLGFPITLAANVTFVIFWLLARKWYFLISLSILIFSATEINETFPFHFSKPEIELSSNHFKLLTYNTKVSGDLKKHTRRRPNKVMQYILDSNADIVCLQEFVVSKNNEYITEKDMLRIFKKYKYKHIDYKEDMPSRKSGIATFSVFPIVNKKRINYTSGANISIFSDIKINNETIRLVNNHLESNRLTEDDKAMPLKLKDNFDADNLSGVTRQLSRKLGTAYKLRARQADIVAKVVQQSPYKVIVCGDFNDVPVSYAYTTVKGKLKDAFSETGRGLGWTFNEKHYGFRIDYVLYDSTAFFPQKYLSEKVKYSDHFPVICNINLKDPIE
jgi:endonuclease/exonuclease/phosphatase family metal-dependent hydrolase